MDNKNVNTEEKNTHGKCNLQKQRNNRKSNWEKSGF